MSNNLASKYRPKTFDDVVEQQLVVKMVKGMCEDPNLEVRNFLFVGPAGTGKANTLDTDILTPNGYVKMRDIQIGQEVITSNGNIGKVLAIILLVLQVAASGGTYPVELMGPFFKAIHPFLPFTYAISMGREAIGGVVSSILIKDIVILVAYIILSLLIGLILKPFINKLMEPFNDKLEESGLTAE